MPSIILNSKRIDPHLSRQLRQGLLTEEEVEEIGQHFLAELIKQKETRELRNKRLVIIIPVLVASMGMMALSSIMRRVPVLVALLPLAMTVAIFVGVIYLIKWLDSRYLKDFIRATKQHYPSISASYEAQFFPKG